MQFSQIIGQDGSKAILRNMAGGQRTPHALMLLGPEGSGKLSLALAFAQYLLCDNPSDEDACGQCVPCKKAEKLIHPDLHFSYPTIGSKATSESFLPQWREALGQNPYLNVNEWLQLIGAENKQGNITKEECVSIIRKLSLKTFEGKYKILILWLPEFLRKEGNRLLKMIEEPPENTIFLLVAENQALILNTILSRCQLVKVNALGDDEIIDGLMETKGLNEEEAKAAAFLADGNFNEAMQLADQKQNHHAAFFLEWMRICYQGSPLKMVPWVEKVAQLGRENQKHFLLYALHFLREYMLLKVAGGLPVRLQKAELETAQKMSKILELVQVEQLSSLFSDCIFAVERNANPKVLFLDASIQMKRIFKTKSPATYERLRPENIL
jgi:DNA polymerase-3 subunit delta'